MMNPFVCDGILASEEFWTRYRRKVNELGLYYPDAVVRKRAGTREVNHHKDWPCNVVGHWKRNKRPGIIFLELVRTFANLSYH
jgi:hypothetical protein